MKMYEILDFSKVYNSIKDEKMSIKTAYKLNKLIKKIEEENNFYNIKFHEIIEQYAEKNGQGEYQYIDENSIKIKEGKEQECYKKVSELQNLEIETPNITFSIEELGDINLTIDTVNMLMPFIEE